MGNLDSSLLDCGFAIGATRYEDYYPGDDKQARIVLSLAPASNSEAATEMIVDTGSPWCILDPELCEVWGLDSGGYIPSSPLWIRGERCEGQLVRATVALQAAHGKELIIEATFFVPLLSLDNTWNYPNFIGLDGFLNRIRFAIDPAENVFYFGPL